MEKIELKIEGMHCFRMCLLPRTCFLGIRFRQRIPRVFLNARTSFARLAKIPVEVQRTSTPRFPNPSDTENRMDGFPTLSFHNASYLRYN